MNMQNTIRVLIAVFLTLTGITVHAQPPNLINYQGMLTGESGEPVSTGEYTIKFGIFTEPIGGTAIWEKTYNNVPVVRGYFNLILGPEDDAGTMIASAFVTQDTFLEITIADGTAVAPRQQILSTPYALNGVLPGTVLPFAGADPPAGYLLCNGQQVSKHTYPALFEIIGTLYGGDGNPSFNLPDLRGRFPLGSSQTYPQASIGGAVEHQLTLDEMPSHAHPYMDVYYSEVSHSSDDPQVDIPGGLGSGNSDNDNTGHQLSRETDPIGGGKAHNNLPPYLSLNFIIRY
jgi:microcystin-dependent protein